MIKLASIIEKESTLDKEKHIIASVYINRLEKGMPLQADPTIVYAYSLDGINKNRLYFSDYKLLSKYNTYLHKGLPPTPICSPGLESIIAALTPDHTNFLYFKFGSCNFF